MVFFHFWSNLIEHAVSKKLRPSVYTICMCPTKKTLGSILEPVYETCHISREVILNIYICSF